jgi:hypothetical protein
MLPIALVTIDCICGGSLTAAKAREADLGDVAIDPGREGGDFPQNGRRSRELRELVYAARKQ